MPEVRVQLSDEQVARIRRGDGWPIAECDGVIDAVERAVREQLPPPIKVGDKVFVMGDRTQAHVVVGVDDGSAWIRNVCHGFYQTVHVSDLVRVEEGE